MYCRTVAIGCEMWVVRKCRRKFSSKYPEDTVPSITCIHKLINEVRSTVPLMDNTRAKKNIPLSYRRETTHNSGQLRTRYKSH
jgi:hypothetical protein